MESDQEQQCSSNNTDCAERTKGETVSYGMLILKQKKLQQIFILHLQRETAGESDDSPSMKNKDAL